MVDSANSDPAVMKSGKSRKLSPMPFSREASQVPSVEALSGAGKPCDIINSSGETDAQEGKHP